MKQIIAKLVAILLIVLILPIHFSFAQSNDKTYIRVGLAFGSGAVSSCTVRSDDGLMIIRVVSGGFEEILSLPDDKQLNVTIESGNIVARESSGGIVYDEFDNDTVIAPLSFADGGVIRYNDRPYRGGVCFFPAGSGRMNVINYIELEHYIYGVLNAEMGHHNPMEALKAQAVTARSYAVANPDRHRNDGFNLCTGVHCQVYRGYSDEFAQTNRAADETAGLVLTYDGEPVSGHYFKNSGGHTQSSVDVWGGARTYLTGVKDEYSPDYPWTYQVTFQVLSSRLQEAGHNVGNVQSVAIKERNSSGAASVIEIRGTSGTAELRRDRVRTVLGSTNVRSMMFSFGGSVSAPESGTVSYQPVLSSGSIDRSAGGNDTVHIIGADGKIEQSKVDNLYVFSDGISVQLGKELAHNQGRLDIVTSSPLIIHGTGYGHGVGMPQDSAIVMAGQGYTFEQILKYFYTEITIQTADY